MFPLEVFRPKRSKGSLKKYLKNICLKTWIVIINIENYCLPIRVYI